MAIQSSGVTGSFQVLPVIPRKDGKWVETPLTLSSVSGLIHKLEMPGLAVRSAEEIGITANFWSAQDLRTTDGVRRGDVAKFTVECGKMLASQIVARDVEILSKSENPFA